MDEKELEQAVKKLLVEACSSRRVLEPGIDLLESGLLDSLGLITLLDGLEDMGIECVIIGHSERRTYFGETDEACAKKVAAAHAHGIRPILCVGESLEQREAGAHFNTVKAQLSGSLAGISGEQAAATVIAYEPVWAIGTGKTATAEQANEMASYIRSVMGELYDAETAERVIIQYGGSVKSSNIAELMAMSDIDGALVGGAGLDPAEFAKIVNFDPSAVGKEPK